ncbi:Mediator of RNA polymerase II transcription subunit 10b [Zostera marina]|uniref:Mediator of RNA polymerase II transcription subunit 10 n=1 Tax=Zostera marina TaxID=29655 RepID=A0A0K9NT20_ZOSMR|nr:Mediator of RNA polymerase II transcription subunit 10b [Zostera marina]
MEANNISPITGHGTTNGTNNNNDNQLEGNPNKQSLMLVNNSIHKTLSLLHQLHLTVSSFNVASQLPLLQRLNALVTELDTMQKLGDSCNIQVPMEVVNLIDDGKNPDEFTKDVFNSCISKNQTLKGKTEAFKSLRNHLLANLEEAFPDDVEVYREIRAKTAAESKRTAQLQNIVPNGEVKVKKEM